jgi:hypothetical protein
MEKKRLTPRRLERSHPFGTEIVSIDEKLLTAGVLDTGWRKQG